MKKVDSDNIKVEITPETETKSKSEETESKTENNEKKIIFKKYLSDQNTDIIVEIFKHIVYGNYTNFMNSKMDSNCDAKKS